MLTGGRVRNLCEPAHGIPRKRLFREGKHPLSTLPVDKPVCDAGMAAPNATAAHRSRPWPKFDPHINDLLNQWLAEIQHNWSATQRACSRH